MSGGPLVIKFGGTSVGDGAAFSGTTDTLLSYADATGGRKDRTLTGVTHKGSIAELYRTLAERHLHAAREVVAPEYLPVVEERLRALVHEPAP